MTVTRLCSAIAVAGFIFAFAPLAGAMTLAQPGRAGDPVIQARGYHHNFFGFYDDPTAPPLFIPPGCQQVFTPDGHARAVCPGSPGPQQPYHHRHHRRHHHHPQHKK